MIYNLGGRRIVGNTLVRGVDDTSSLPVTALGLTSSLIARR